MRLLLGKYMNNDIYVRCLRYECGLGRDCSQEIELASECRGVYMLLNYLRCVQTVLNLLQSGSSCFACFPLEPTILLAQLCASVSSITSLSVVLGPAAALMGKVRYVCDCWLRVVHERILELGT